MVWMCSAVEDEEQEQCCMVIYVCVIICKIRTATALVLENWTGNEWELQSDSRRNNHTIIVYNKEFSLIYINPTYLFMILFSENKYISK